MAISLVSAHSGRLGATIQLQNLFAGDLVTVQTTREGVGGSVSFPGTLLRYYSISGFGYLGNYTARMWVYEVPSDGTFTITISDVFGYLVCVWRADTPVKWLPLDATFYNSVPSNNPRSFAVPDGVFLLTTCNETWRAEWTWYPVIQGNIALDQNVRMHDAFLSAGRTTDGTVTVTLAVLSSGDMWGVPIAAAPRGYLFCDFFMV